MDDQDFRRAVRELQQQVNNALDESGVTGAEATLQYGKAVITNVVRTYADNLALLGRSAPTLDEEEQLKKAVENRIFYLGDLQPLVDDPEVENIDVNRYDQVWVTYTDGRKVPGPPAADSEDELIENVRRWGIYQGQNARDFSTARPILHKALSNTVRLAAATGITPHTAFSIRKHGMLDATMSDLAARGTMSWPVRHFLHAVMNVPMNVIVAGAMNSGKSTLVRALAGDIDPFERLITVENERELFLHLMPERHHDVLSFEARAANSEGEGAVTMRQLIDDAFRFNGRRILVGEVRSDELVPMLVAMNSGGRGSICTMHADSAEEIFPRMEILAGTMPADALFRLVGKAVDFIVYLRHEVSHDPDAPMNVRYISEIFEVLPPADSVVPAVNRVFVPGPDGRAVPNVTPQCMDKLVKAGFDATMFVPRAGGLWN
ncbi:CpaF family protein [Microbispora sp. RL4-1S]|uniref:CpaF family protein n=1 Tax=Microbispora oryzae TaxID=2806554 RepID=A0A940WP13_9ACTN|nr:CpaF/VirB11 family protein [Microbispora oryzae]MBP2707372.1 CpaF family protein [Microbispora oryzae]